ncbi:hypothetical protein B9Z55_026757 [Caenorhabditis nigoni]|uniref:Serpentine receptor class gamma n=1 Tax=Caenorhabditis nigoni TaxID=1611254 RepID=A0A2G5SH91_9PELO|nr:hypothetical protein B9Z55_026757 [Caenorhabditis nigoni]
MFPFYVYVNRVNRERDKNTLVFPMIDHFYGIMKKTQAIYCFLWFFIFFLFEKLEDFEKQKIGIPLVALFLCLKAMLIFIQVSQFFLTVMAIQKFLLYFYPTSQKYTILSPNNMKYFIRYSYCLFIVRDIIGVIMVNFSKKIMKNDVKGAELTWLAIHFDVIFFATLNISFFISALLYIPILISVRKKSHLRSVQESKPQIYIFWQTITVLVVKMIYTPYFLFVHFDNFKTMIILTRMLDCFSIPVIIQISYLTCNRQNVITLFASFRGMKLIKELIKPEVTTRVSPDPRRHLV